MSPQFRGILCACITSIIFALLAIVLKLTLKFADANTIVFLRFSVAFFGLVIILAWRGHKPLTHLARPPWLAIVTGLMLAGNYIWYMKGIDMTTAANAQVVIQLSPFLLAIFGILFFKEKMSKRQIAGMIVALFGLLYFYEDRLEHMPTGAEEYRTGNFWIVISALCWAAWGALQKILGHRMNPQIVNLIVYGVAGICTAFLANWTLIGSFDFKMWLLMIFLGFNTLIAYGTLAESLRLIPVYLVSIIVTVNPLLTLVALQLMEQFTEGLLPPENISIASYLGAAVFLGGVLMVVIRRTPPAKIISN